MSVAGKYFIISSTTNGLLLMSGEQYLYLDVVTADVRLGSPYPMWNKKYIQADYFSEKNGQTLSILYYTTLFGKWRDKQLQLYSDHDLIYKIVVRT